MIETEASLPDLARAIGLTERRVATVKAEGRLPLTPAGKADVAALLRMGWTAALAAKGTMPRFDEPTAEDLAAVKGLAPGLAFTEPMHRAFMLAALSVLYEGPILAALAAAEAGATRQQAERTGDVLLMMLWQMMDKLALQVGIPDLDGEGPVRPHMDVVEWRGGVNWPGLYGAEGESLTVGCCAAAEAAG